MAYKITYGKVMPKTFETHGIHLPTGFKSFRVVISFIFCIICCGALIFELYRTNYLSNQTEDIQRALSTLVDDLQQGRGVDDAIDAFCEEILERDEP